MDVCLLLLLLAVSTPRASARSKPVKYVICKCEIHRIYLLRADFQSKHRLECLDFSHRTLTLNEVLRKSWTKYRLNYRVAK